MGRILKTLIFEGNISLSLIDSTDIVNKAIEYHDLSELTAAALGRTLTASVFMASNLKNEGDKLSITVSGDGVGGHIIVSADSSLNVRGYIDNPKASLPLKANGKLDVSGCVGKGRITITRIMGLKEPYTGSSEIISGELAEDFSYYYAVSEQEPTAMALGVKVSGNGECVGAGGVIIQVLPGVTEEEIAKAEEIISRYPDISTIIETIGAKGLIERDFSEYEFTERKAEYKCVCSNDYISSLIISLGKEEALSIINEVGKIEIKCQYCDKNYIFTKEETENLFKN
jgi:molecular chaperone Hsp33